MDGRDKLVKHAEWVAQNMQYMVSFYKRKTFIKITSEILFLAPMCCVFLIKTYSHTIMQCQGLYLLFLFWNQEAN